MQFLGKLGLQVCSLDLFTQLISNKFCSTVTHIVHHKTCSVTTHAQSHLMLRQPRESVVGLIKMPSLLVVVAVSVLMPQLDWTLFLPQLSTEKVDLSVQCKMSFLFTSDYVYIRLQLQILW